MGLQDMKRFLAFIISLWIPVRIKDSLSFFRDQIKARREARKWKTV